MDSLNFDWLDNDRSANESLVASTPVQISKTSNEILQYLLQDAQTNFTPTVVQSPQPPLPDQLTTNFQPNDPKPSVNEPKPAINESSSKIYNPSLSNSLSVVQNEGNFVTFMPLNNTPRTTKKPAMSKKIKMKDSIFVTESPQNSYKKKKKSSPQLSSGEENSDDDMLLDEEYASNSKLKHMTAKERRQLRNKISARNFRVRRKEYITQLEEKVELHEQTIEKLTQENCRLKAANDELMKQLLNQPLTPPSSDNVLSSSGSEGNYSPEAVSVPTMFQFQLNDLYDLNLFDQQQQQQEPIDNSNLFYLNHAVIPDWDIHQVLGEKGRPITADENDRESVLNLLNEYPLLAPALMSIVVRHTLSLEYVTAIAKEFYESVESRYGAEETPEENTKNIETLKIEDSDKVESQDEAEFSFTDEEFLRMVMNTYLPNYLLARARGKSHDEVIERFKECYIKSPKCFKKHKEAALAQRNRMRAGNSNQKNSNEDSSSPSNYLKSSKLSTLHTYCKVAGTLLKHPSRMTRVNQVLKEEIGFKYNKHTAHVESNYVAMISSVKNLRITNSAK